MRPFEEYLLHLRSSLEVDPRRAEEICAEVRGHLEERAAQFRETGLAADEAAVGAVRSFGDPRNMGTRLSAANTQHRRTTPYRAAVTLVLALGGATAAFGALVGHSALFAPLYGWLESWPYETQQVLLWPLVSLLACPAVVLAGLVGTRHWWTPVLPGIALGAFGLVTLQIGPALGILLLATPIAVGCAYLGRRLSFRRSAARGATFLCACCLTLLLLSALIPIARDIIAWAAATLVCLGVLGLLAAWTSRRAPPGLLIAGCVWSGAALLAVSAGILGGWEPFGWLVLVLLEAGIGIPILLYYQAYQRRERRKPKVDI
jgi:hypothetical protein